MKFGDLTDEYMFYRQNRKFFSKTERAKIRKSLRRKISEGMNTYLKAIDDLNR